MKSKTFDCVEMKRQGQRRLHELLKDMTAEQQLDWWRQRNEKFLRKQERLRTERSPAASAPATNK